MANTLQHSQAEVVRKLLVDLGLGVEPVFAANAYTGGAWPCFDSGEPDLPDNCITVYDTAGRGLGRSMLDGSDEDALGFQVRVRAVTHPVGWVKADAIKVALAEQVSLRQVNVGGVRYLVWCVHDAGQVLSIGNDVSKTKRKLFTLNAMLAVRPY